MNYKDITYLIVQNVTISVRSVGKKSDILAYGAKPRFETCKMLCLEVAVNR